ncbi:MAG: alkaline phosphatase D family protein, partial [Nitrososphaeraceae archaeon]|nr:alkaline phosphatase D family protein [Nitrososphaeraceae archaeon]
MIKYCLISSILLISLILIYFDCIPDSLGEEKKIFITHGVASGDVTNNSSIIWSKANTDSIMNVKYDYNKDFSSSPQTISTPVNESTFFTGHIKLNNLINNTTYYYQIWFTDLNNSSSRSDSMKGKFKTAPDEDQMDNIHFTMAGDLGGSTLCRQEGIGYQIFSIMNNISPDFFIFNGDQIYADYECPHIPKFSFPLKNYPYWKNIKGEFKSITDKAIDWENITQLTKTYLEHWKYNRADLHLQTFLGNTSFYSQSDDHEVINNYGGEWKNYSISDYQYERNRKSYPNLVNVGIDLFFKFSPIERNQIEKDRIYRSF